MRYILSFAMLLVTAATAYADDYSYMVFVNTDGEATYLPAMGTKITFADGQLQAVSGEESATLDLSTLSYMAFTNDTTGSDDGSGDTDDTDNNGDNSGDTGGTDTDDNSGDTDSNGDTDSGSGDTDSGSGDTDSGSGDTDSGSGDTDSGNGDTDGGTSAITNVQSGTISIGTDAGSIIVTAPGGRQVTVTSISGAVVARGITADNGTTTLGGNIATGVYIVRIDGNTTKIVVR